jgi:hypothetical protein
MSEYRNHESFANNDNFQDLVFTHQSAMTGETLHSKIDIAKELAHRDYQIQSLKLRLQKSDPIDIESLIANLP